MKTLLCVALCFVYAHSMLLNDLEREDWELFKLTHKKQYGDNREEAFRKKIYQENKLKIMQHNKLYEAGIHKFSMAMNEFGDLLHHEFKRTMNGFLRSYNASKYVASTYISPVHSAPPKSKDWRKLGAVTAIKNQGQCGSCWSFSTTGSLEGQHFRKTGKLVSLSEQNLIDCSTSYGNHGCNGGLMDQAFQYIKDNGGIDTEASYPYLAEDEKCHFKHRNIGATDSGFVDVPHGNEEKLKEASANIGPISVAINAGLQSFQFYHQGVYDEPDCDPQELDHGVLVVGYGSTEQGEDYWIVKNSWGTSWGQEGYIYMSRNKQNQCGIASQASYPLV